MTNKIKWTPHSTTEDVCGIIDIMNKEREIFTIKKISSKKLTSFKLLSWSIPNQVFAHTTNSRELGVFENIEIAQNTAEILWIDYKLSFS